MTDRDIEVRRLQPGYTNDLARILDEHDAWKKVMSRITHDSPKDGSKVLKYTASDIGAIEYAGRSGAKSCTEIFLSEWGTSGRERPTVRVLLHFLLEVELYRAAKYVSEELLKEPFSMHTSETTISELSNLVTSDSRTSYSNLPTAECTDDEFKDCSGRFVVEESNALQEQFIQEKIENVSVISYDVVKACTRNFDPNIILGSGGFGTVYSGVLDTENVAIKKLNFYDKESDWRQQFKNELSVLSQCNDHPNILPLKAVSLNKVPCLIYELMPNGSLDKRLACKLENFPPMSWQKRVDVAKDISNGLKYLHTAFENPFIHRDIKSANILLDDADVAKIGDFGLVRKQIGSMTSNTSTFRGTNAYSAPEAFQGTISLKTDIFSYGVVLLELLTGLPALSSDRKGGESLVDYVQEIAGESEKFNELLDEKAGSWDINVWKEIYDLYKRCTAYWKKDRPEICEVDAAMTRLKESISKTVG